MERKLRTGNTRTCSINWTLTELKEESCCPSVRIESLSTILLFVPLYTFGSRTGYVSRGLRKGTRVVLHNPVYLKMSFSLTKGKTKYTVVVSRPYRSETDFFGESLVRCHIRYGKRPPRVLFRTNRCCEYTKTKLTV